MPQLRKTRAIASFRPDWWRTGLWCAQEPEREQERMFGHHNLYRDGVPARSVIISVLEGVEVKDGHSKHEQMVGRWEVPHEAPGHKVFYDVVARVEFDDGTTAQHTERLWRHDVGACSVGDVLPVRYDRQYRDKIVFDMPQLEANRYSPKER
jgi:hypothetical protein